MDLSLPANILAFLQVHGYSVLFLIIMLEGSIITYVAGFAASSGIFNVWFLLILAPIANTIADSVYFLIGRFGKGTSVYRFFLNRIGPEKVARIEHYLYHNLGKTLLVIKFTPPLPVPGLILSGTAKVPFRKFVFYSFLLSAVYSSILITLGFYSGVAFSTVSGYLKYVEIAIGLAVFMIVVVPIIIRKVSQKLSVKIEKI